MEDEAPMQEQGCENDGCTEPTLPTWYCVDCDSSYCTRCWPRQGPHKRDKKGRDGVPHEKVDVSVVRRLHTILSPSNNVQDIQRLHEEDQDTKWFGVVRDSTGRPILEEYGRYTSLMSGIDRSDGVSNQFPQLVSFIGVTNAGKSSLINMLIQHDTEHPQRNDGAMFPTPIVGSKVHDSVPTSGDVHLYADPTTYTHRLPILYADCEGFEGGEKLPLGSQSHSRARGYSDTDGSHRENGVHRRLIQWASTEESRRREYAVTALYPRLLYTFSDCVVFVLRNPRTFQSAVLTKLLDWGAAAMEKSINQPTLPHCIVVLNGSDLAIRSREWDVAAATQSLLSTVNGAIDYVEGVPRFRELANHWRRLGSHIGTVEDLILRYYSSFKVVRVPVQPHYEIINEQIGKLQAAIRDDCGQSFRTKHRARMLIGGDELDAYLQSGFDHFTAHLDTPFNFMHASLQRNPIPDDFGGHILRLCTTLSTRFPPQRHDTVRWIFEKLSTMLASCVLLDCARFRKGRLNELFASYERFFDYAMAEFLELHSPCSFTSADGRRKCMVAKARHEAKGHQDELGIIAAGDHVAAFDWRFAQQWKEQLRTAIECLHRDFSFELEQAALATDDLGVVTQDRIALDLHLQQLNRFFQSVGPATSVVSHVTCFACLMHTPEHPLPCGHVLCHECVCTHGTRHKRSVVMTCCPLHRDNSRWVRPAIIRLKPAGAGVRVLALDGGGIRGVVQLEILSAVERAMGGHLVVQKFFDLIVGTGTGGLIGTALSKEGNTIDRAMDMFAAICEHAYSPRWKGRALASHLVQVIGPGPRYRAEPLHAALKTAFGSHDDFFGCTRQFWSDIKVAVTSTGAAQGETILHASYRRPHDSDARYHLHRPHEPAGELKTWECICAAMSNRYFKPFSVHNTAYLDGSTHCANPAAVADGEWKRIWHDESELDILLSLGTGQNRTAIVEKLSARPRESSSLATNKVRHGKADEVRRVARKWRLGKVDDVLDAETAWQSFKTAAVQEQSHSYGKRLIRFNPDLGEDPPAQDQTGQLRRLQALTHQKLNDTHRIAAVDNIAQRLIATSFYLEVSSQTTGNKGETVVRGVIACRFDDGSAEMIALGKILSERRTDSFEPYFLVRPVSGSSHVSSRITLTSQKLLRMTHDAIFEQSRVLFQLQDETCPSSIHLFLSSHDGLEPEGFTISGFPRAFSIQAPGRDRLGSSDEQSILSERRRQIGRRSSVHSESVFSNHPALASIGGMTNSSKRSWSSSIDSARSFSIQSPLWQDPYGDIPCGSRKAGMSLSHRQSSRIESSEKPHRSPRSSDRRLSRMSLEQEWHAGGGDVSSLASRFSVNASTTIVDPSQHHLSLAGATQESYDGISSKGDIPQPLQVPVRHIHEKGPGARALHNEQQSPCRTLFEEDEDPDARYGDSRSLVVCLQPKTKEANTGTDTDTLSKLVEIYADERRSS